MGDGASHAYLVALGSNQRHVRGGRPARIIDRAVEALCQRGLAVEAVSAVVTSAPVGPSQRRYANAAALIRTGLAPLDLLAELQSIETDFGRRRRGQRWRSRTLDLDIVLWSGGIFDTPDFSIPHPAFRGRVFVLGPLLETGRNWRDPVTGLAVRHLHARLVKPRPLRL